MRRAGEKAPATFRNPVLKGFYPDPSVCRVGDDYYLVTSSFYYFPGLPVFHSRDLVHWRQIGNAISRPEQLDFRGCDHSEGLWAPTIRYHDGLFYIVDTLDVNGRTDRYNFIITAKDPAGPWSDAVIVKGAIGIDPSLYFDEEGRIWFMSNQLPEKLLYPQQKQIILGELDPETFQFRGEPKVILDAADDHSMYMEAPHILKKDGWYYLLTAEGGTQTDHCVNFYRSRSLQGPYEACPRDPVVTNRDLPLINGLGVSVVGHGDLVETQNGEWYMVLLGIRPYEYPIEDYDRYGKRMWIRPPDRNKAAQFNLGRETFLVPIAWDYDGWPLVDNERGRVGLTDRAPDLPWCREPWQSRVDNFEEPTLDLVWCMQRPPKETYWSLTERPGYLRLRPLTAVSEDRASSAVILRRQQDNDFQAACAMEAELKEGEESGILLTQNARFSYLLVKRHRTDGDHVTCWQTVNGVRELLGDAPVPAGRLYLFVEGRVGAYSFYWGTSERDMRPLVTDAPGHILSTLVSDGFVGTFVGMYAATPDPETSTRCDFDWFRYEPIDQ